MQKFLKYIIYGGLFIVPFLPFAVSNGLFFPFITTKGFIFRIIVEIVAAGYVALAIFNKNYRPRFSWLTTALIVFLVVIGLADLLGENPTKSFWSNYERMEGWFLLFHLFLYYLVATNVLRTERLWSYFWNTTLGASVLVTFMGFLQLFGLMRINQGDVRLDANIGNATYLAVYLLFHIFIALFLFARRKEKTYSSWIYPLIAFAHLVILYHTATRGALLGLLGGLFLTGILVALFEKERKQLRRFSIGLVVGVLVLVGGFLLVKDTSFVKNSPVLSRFNPQKLESTAGTRFLVWNIAWEGFKERPVLGWGQESFNYVFSKHYDPHMYDQEQWFDRTHNIIFDWLIAGGFLGLLAYLSIPIISLALLWRKTNFSVVDKAILTGLLAAYFFQNLFVFDNLLSYILFFSVVSFIYVGSSGQTEVMDMGPQPETKESNFVLPITAIVLVLVMYFINYNFVQANRSLIQGFVALQTNQIDRAYELFKKSLAYDSAGSIEVREQMAQVASSIVQSQNVDMAVKQKFFDLGFSSLQDQINETPKDIRHRVLLGSFLNGAGMFDQAIPVLEEAQKLSPRKQIIFYELGTTYINKGEFAKAFELFKGAYELAPEFQEVKLLYAMAAVYAGEDEVADEIIPTLDKKRRYLENRLLAAYEHREQYSKIVEILKERIVMEPTNYNHHVSLAATYLKMNRRNEAVAELNEAIKLNSEFKEQGEYYISEIKAGRNP